MTALAELTTGWDAYYRAVEANDGVVTPELEAEHDVLRIDTAEKVDGYVFRIKAFQGDVEALKKLEAEVTQRRKAKEAEIERLQDRVAVHMDVLKLKALPGAILKGFKIQDAGGKQALEILLEDPTLWPQEYQKVTVALDTEKVRADLDETGELNLAGYGDIGDEGLVARLKERGKVLRMYV